MQKQSSIRRLRIKKNDICFHPPQYDPAFPTVP
jgi:hypothetical protein